MHTHSSISELVQHCAPARSCHMTMHYQETIAFEKLQALCKLHWTETRPGSKSFERLLVAPAEEVVEAHEGFFKSLAAEQSKLNKSTFLKALASVVKMDHDALAQFAHKIVHCQKVIWGKSKHMTTGAKLGDAMCRCAKLYKSGKDGSTLTETTRTTPSPSPSPSPSPEPPAAVPSGAASSLLQEAEKNAEAAKRLWSSVSVGSPDRKAKRCDFVVADSPFSIASTPRKPDPTDAAGKPNFKDQVHS